MVKAQMVMMIAIVIAIAMVLAFSSWVSAADLQDIPSSGNISWWCGQVPNKETCEFYLIPAGKDIPSIITKSKFLEMSLQVTLKRMSEALIQIRSLWANVVDEKEKVALSDCLKLYNNTILLLGQALNDLTNGGNQVELCGGLANLESCQNGFVELNVKDNILPQIMANNASKLLVNDLAVNAAHQDSPPQQQHHFWEGDDFPEWVPRRDRSLLLAAASHKADVVVAQDGSGKFKTISEALQESLKRTDYSKRFVIYIKKGTYSEYLTITSQMENIMLVGDGVGNTIITGDRSVRGGFTIISSPTVGVEGKGFIARDITFRNTAGPENFQAVALLSRGQFSVFYLCGIEAYQDSLVVHSQIQFYRECSISGTIDFICGDAAVVFQKCNIIARKPLHGQENTITAQARLEPTCPTGIVIHQSHIMASPDLEPVQNEVQTFLGRPWKDYARTLVMKSSIDSLLDPAGWLDWDNKTSTLYYGEYQNYGPGSDTSKRVKWPGYHVITDANEASAFSVRNFIYGKTWLPQTDVPFIPDI